MWLRIDDSMYDHPKFEEAPLAAIGVWLRMLSYSGRHLTGGNITEKVALKMARGDQVLVDELTRSGLLEACEDGYKLHDFEDYNPDTEEERLAKSEGGKKGAKIRWSGHTKTACRVCQKRGRKNCKECSESGVVTPAIPQLHPSYTPATPQL